MFNNYLYSRVTALVVMMPLLLVSVAPGHDKAAAPAHEAKVEGAFAAIVVTDLEASLKWYQSTFGMRVVKQGRSPRVAVTTVVLAGNNLFIELIHYDTPAPPRPPLDDTHALTPGILKVGIIVDRQDFDSLVQRLHGQVFDDKEMRVRSFLVKDNEANLLQFFVRMK